MESLTKQMNRMESKLGELDKEVKDLKRSQRERRPPWRNKDNRKEVSTQSSIDSTATRTSDGTKEVPLNLKGPLSQGR